MRVFLVCGLQQDNKMTQRTTLLEELRLVFVLAHDVITVLYCDNLFLFTFVLPIFLIKSSTHFRSEFR